MPETESGEELCMLFFHENKAQIIGERSSIGKPTNHENKL
jgi:hypothetical protein